MLLCRHVPYEHMYQYIVVSADVILLVLDKF